MLPQWTPGVSSILGACAAAELVALSSIDMMADRTAMSGARLVATQGISARAIGALMPAALSHDGRLIAFVSQDRRAARGPCCQNVYMLDRSTGLITQESIGLDGSWPDGNSQGPSLSSDGRILAFETEASNLPSGDGRSGSRRVVVRDRRNGVWRTPKNPFQQEPNGETRQPIVAGSGVAVVFTSDATNLVPGSDANGHRTDIYRWRLEDSTITRVSVDNHSVQPSIGVSYSPSVSRDGELVAFVSTARLAAEDTNDVADVYVRDLQRGLTSLVDPGIDGKPSDAPSYLPELSADGRYVAFVSKAGRLAPKGRDQDSDVYLYEVASGTIALVSATSKGEAANASSSRPAISADGRNVVFQSVASNLGSRRGCPTRVLDKNLLADIYLFDRTTGCVTRISGSSAREWWTPSVAPAISGSGAVVAFSSSQPMSDDDATTDFDLFLLLRPDSEPSPAAPHCSVRNPVTPFNSNRGTTVSERRYPAVARRGSIVRALDVSAAMLTTGRTSAAPDWKWLIVTEGPNQDEEREALVAALRLLPGLPARVAVIDALKAKPDVQPTLLRLDAFVIIGSPVVYVVRQSQLLEGARKRSSIHVHALAAVLWHEMAHVDGGDEREARRREQALWTSFVRDQRVDDVAALRYLKALHERPDDQLLATR